MMGEMDIEIEKTDWKRNKIYVLNSAVLTSFGVYRYTKITIGLARDMLRTNEFISAVGHEPTAELMTKILGVKIPYNRIEVKMQIGDVAVVFRLKKRIQEGKVLNEEEIQTLDYEIGLLERVG
jgi:hypothetical protein